MFSWVPNSASFAGNFFYVLKADSQFSKISTQELSVSLLATFCHILHTLLCLLGQVAPEKARDEHACDQCMHIRHVLQSSLE